MSNRTVRVGSVAWVALLTVVAGCHEGGDSSPCEGVDCSGHGSCWHDGSRARCDCDDGYRVEALSCVPTAETGDGDGDVDTDVDGDADSDVDGDVDVDGDADTDGEPPCDVVTGSGCGAGEKCTLYLVDGSSSWLAGCVSWNEAAAARPGESCAATVSGDQQFDNCPQGYICATTVGHRTVCHKLCDSGRTGECADAYPSLPDNHQSGLCLLDYNLPGEGLPPLMACAFDDGCQPACQDCVEGACFAGFDGVHSGTLCAAAGAVEAGDACGSMNACAPGLQCVGGICSRLCSIDPVPGCEPYTCLGGTECVHPASFGSLTSIGTCE